jgi:hypothetical protein
VQHNLHRLLLQDKAEAEATGNFSCYFKDKISIGSGFLITLADRRVGAIAATRSKMLGEEPVVQ